MNQLLKILTCMLVITSTPLKADVPFEGAWNGICSGKYYLKHGSITFEGNTMTIALIKFKDNDDSEPEPYVHKKSEKVQYFQSLQEDEENSFIVLMRTKYMTEMMEIKLTETDQLEIRDPKDDYYICTLDRE